MVGNSREFGLFMESVVDDLVYIEQDNDRFFKDKKRKRFFSRKTLLFKCNFKTRKKYTIRNMLPQRIRVNENKIIEL